MAKIRGIKPETWTDETFVELSPLARLLYIGMWNYACDNGHLEDRSKQLKMRLLPGDDCNVADLLRELEKWDRITREDGWITIPTLRDHQRIDKRWFVTCDKPGCEKPTAEKANPERKPRRGHDEATSSARGGHDGASRGPRDDVDVDVDLNGVDVDLTSASAEAEREFEEWYAEFPRKRGKGQAAKAYRTARKKANAEVLLTALRQQRAALVAKGIDYCPYPSTWLNGERWEDEPGGNVQPIRRPGEGWVDENGVHYFPDGSVDVSTLPPIEDNGLRMRPRR